MTSQRKKPALVISPEQDAEIIREIEEARRMFTRKRAPRETAAFLLAALAEAYPRLAFPRSLKEIERALAPIYEREGEKMPVRRVIAKAIGRA